VSRAGERGLALDEGNQRWKNEEISGLEVKVEMEEVIYG